MKTDLVYLGIPGMRLTCRYSVSDMCKMEQILCQNKTWKTMSGTAYNPLHTGVIFEFSIVLKETKVSINSSEDWENSWECHVSNISW